MWNVIITLTSVGYGELYPKTFFGRIVGIIICFWGVFIVSFFVVTVTNMLNFSASEEKSYNLLLRLYYKLELKREAVAVLSSAYAHRNAKQIAPTTKPTFFVILGTSGRICYHFNRRLEQYVVSMNATKMWTSCKIS